MIKFEDAIIKGQRLILDGGMGSRLVAKGYDFSGDTYNLSCPQGVEEVHREYIEAGCNCIITNTLTLNSIYSAKKGGLDLAKANAAGVEIAKKAAAGKAYVLGDMGPTGDLLQPFGAGREEDFFASFLEQAKYLAGAGADGFIIETVFQLKEALLALKACREVSNLPVIVSLTFSSLKKGGVTFMGDTAIKCAEAVKEAGGTVIGANCGDLNPEELAQIAENMLPVGLPVCVQPNAGKPRLENGLTYYDMSPGDFARGMEACLKAGVQLVGGCCGTTPEHIKALVKLIAQKGY